MASTVVGLDFGNGVIRAAELADVESARPTIVKYATIAVAPTALRRGEVVEPGTVTTALKQLWANAKFSTKTVTLGVGNQRVLVRDITVPQLPLAHIRKSLPFQVQDMLQVPAAEAILDFFPTSAIRSDAGPQLSGLLIAAVKEPVLRNVEAVRAAGLKTSDVDLIPFALTRLFASENDLETTAIVHIGAATTVIVIARGQLPKFVRIVQTGGEDLTAAITEHLDMTSEQAQQYKRELGLMPTHEPRRAPIAQVIATSTGELINSVRNTLSFYLGVNSTARIDRVVLSGGGGRLPGLAEALAAATHVPVTQSDAFARLRPGRSFDPKEYNRDPAAAEVSIGLAIGGVR